MKLRLENVFYKCRAYLQKRVQTEILFTIDKTHLGVYLHQLPPISSHVMFTKMILFNCCWSCMTENNKL